MIYVLGTIVAVGYIAVLVLARNAKEEMEVFRKARGWRGFNDA